MNRISPYINNRGFTLAELIVGMTIFAVGMTAILAMLQSAINNSLIAKNEIIAANILREQIELVKNTRNTNIRSFAPWGTSITPGVFTIENNYGFSSTTYVGGIITESPVSVSVSPIIPSDSLEQKFKKSQLYIDSNGRYTHTPTLTGTSLASYIMISPLAFSRPHTNPTMTTIEPKSDDGKNQGYILDARVIIRGDTYREYDLKTVITDWQR